MTNKKELEGWISREINCSLNQLKNMQRYQKAREEGYVSALKKIQARLRDTLN